MDGGGIRRKWKREKNIKKTGNIIMNVELKVKDINLNKEIMIDHNGDMLYHLRQIVSLLHEGFDLFVLLLYNHDGNIKPLA